MDERDSDTDSLDSIAAYEEIENASEEDEQQYIESVREAVKNWKLRELQNNTTMNKKPNGLQPLRNYVANSAKLYYTLNSYLGTSQNKDDNMKDKLYVSIISAIGSPASLSNHLRTLLESLLQRDLIELPLTVEPKIVNVYTQKGLHVNKNFPDEE